LKIRQVDKRQQQTGNPENVHVGEERYQTQNGDDLELKLFVAQTFGQRMQPEK
jgi:hypothetical protein